MHVVADTLGDGLPLQLREHRGDVHHRAAHGRAGVELLLDGHKGDVQPGQFFNQPGEIADIAADAVQPVHDDGLELLVAGSLYHLLEVWTVQIAAGEALVLVDDNVIGKLVVEMGADVLSAQFNLVADAFALAGELGFA